MQTADAVVIGGGIMGASVAFHLAARGLKNLILLDRRFLAAGGTGKSTALVRLHYDNYPEARMVYESWKIFAEWSHRVGGDCGFVRTGFVQTVLPGETGALKANVEMQQAIGIPTRLITGAELHELEPDWETADIEYAAYEPESGYADPQAATLSLADGARSRGAQIWQETAAAEILVSGSRVLGVRTNRGDISAPVVVIAAGPWSGALVRPLGVELPIRPERHQLATFRRPLDLTRRHACCIDGVLEMYFKPEGQNLTVVGAGVGQKNVDPDRYNEGADEDVILLAAERISRRIPKMERALSQGGWSGIYDMTPDEKMILDRLPYDGLYVTAGHSGTGFKMGPAVGLLLSEWICDGRVSTMDVSPFRLSRFAEGKPLYDQHPYSTRWYTTGEQDRTL